MSKVEAKRTMKEEALSLTRALRLDDVDYFDSPKSKPIVSIVGGGGKTMTMFTLANELAAQGKRVVTTTTTRLFASQRAESPAWCAANQLGQLGKLLDEHQQCLVTAPDESWADGKARGITVEQVTALAVVASIPVGLLSVALLVVNNLRDIPGDTESGKQTLAVRLGDRSTRLFYVGLMVAIGLGVIATAGFRWPALLGLIGLLVAIAPVRTVLGGALGPALIPGLGANGKTQLATGLGLAVGLVLGG